MTTVAIKIRAKDVSMDKIWKIITDIEKYPERVKFVKSVIVYGKEEEGSKWDDTTLILWIPLVMHHTITAMKKNREYSFSIPLSFGGRMTQTYLLTQDKEKNVVVEGIISYDLGNVLLNSTIGLVLKGRLRDMLKSSVQFIDGDVIS